MTPKRKPKGGDDFELPVTVGQTPPPRDHVTPVTRGPVASDVEIFGGPPRGSIGSYLRIAAEHAGKCDAALECAIEVAQNDVALAILIPVLSQLRLDAGKLQRSLEERRKA